MLFVLTCHRSLFLFPAFGLASEGFCVEAVLGQRGCIKQQLPEQKVQEATRTATGNVQVHIFRHRSGWRKTPVSNVKQLEKIMAV